MEQLYYLALDLGSFAVPFAFSFEKKRMNFSRFFRPVFSAIILVGLFFIAWDIFFSVKKIWGFNPRYILGINILWLPLEEWLFFLLIPFASNFIHYSLNYFFPKLTLTKRTTQAISLLLTVISAGIVLMNTDKLYTLCCLGLFAALMLMQCIFQWPQARRFFLSFLLIYIPFFLVNSALTGFFTPEPVVSYNNVENLGIRLGTIPLEDSFYCFTMLYSAILLADFLAKKWGYSIDFEKTTQQITS